MKWTRIRVLSLIFCLIVAFGLGISESQLHSTPATEAPVSSFWSAGAVEEIPNFRYMTSSDNFLWDDYHTFYWNDDDCPEYLILSTGNRTVYAYILETLEASGYYLKHTDDETGTTYFVENEVLTVKNTANIYCSGTNGIFNYATITEPAAPAGDMAPTVVSANCVTADLVVIRYSDFSKVGVTSLDQNTDPGYMGSEVLSLTIYLQEGKRSTGEVTILNDNGQIRLNGELCSEVLEGKQ